MGGGDDVGVLHGVRRARRADSGIGGAAVAALVAGTAAKRKEQAKQATMAYLKSRYSAPGFRVAASNQARRQPRT
jgi:hypothetical protein